MSFLQEAEFDNQTIPPTLLNPQILTEHGQLGRGSFGEVFLVSDSSGAEYALKLLKPTPDVTDDDIAISPDERRQIDANTFAMEVGAIKSISSYPNCLKYSACYIAGFKILDEGVYKYALLTEYVPGTDLVRAVEDENDALLFKLDDEKRNI